MKTRIRKCLILGICALASHTHVLAGVDECLRLLQQNASEFKAGRERCSEMLISDLGRPESSTCAELLRLLQGDSSTLDTRVAALDILTAGVPASRVGEFVDALRRIGEQSQTIPSGQAATDAFSLLNQFAANLAAIPKQVQHTQGYLNVLSDLATDYVCSPQAKSAAIEMISKSEAPVSVRRAAAIRVLKKQNQTRAIIEFMPLLDRDAEVELLRELAARLEDGDVRYGVAATLAYRGVTEATPVLEEAVRVQSDIRKRGILSEYLWQIDVQQRPDGLLEFIAKAQPRADIVRVGFALRRAVDSGIPGDQIRQSLFKLAERAPDGDRINIHAMSQIKRLAIELGVLSTEDLARISVNRVPGPER